MARMINAGRKRRVTGAAAPGEGGVNALIGDIARVAAVEAYGRVVGVNGLVAEIAGPVHLFGVGSRLRVDTATGPVLSEIVGFRDDRALVLAYGRLDGVRLGSKAILAPHEATARPADGWL